MFLEALSDRVKLHPKLLEVLSDMVMGDIRPPEGCTIKQFISMNRRASSKDTSERSFLLSRLRSGDKNSNDFIKYVTIHGSRLQVHSTSSSPLHRRWLHQRRWLHVKFVQMVASSKSIRVCEVSQRMVASTSTVTSCEASCEAPSTRKASCELPANTVASSTTVASCELLSTTVGPFKAFQEQ